MRREPPEVREASSAIPLKHPYFVPGGRFREIYYWDSFFTLLGVVEDGLINEAVQVLDNFADLVRRFGRIPNGTRTYYLSRSQPPVLYLIVQLLSQKGAIDPSAYLDVLIREHAFWMEGAASLKEGMASARVVKLPDGAVLNRHWDDIAAPRDESFVEDVTVARHTKRAKEEVYRDLRAAAESGWDFSSRWMSDPADLGTIQTTSIIPVDLNSFLWGLETAIADICRGSRDSVGAERYAAMANARKASIDQWLWDIQAACYGDLNWRTLSSTRCQSAAAVTPLFVGLADPEKAACTDAFVRSYLLRGGGVVTTGVGSGQQWDAPYGWAPFQWMSAIGLARYGYQSTAKTIAERWVKLVSDVYYSTGLFFEKYDVEKLGSGGGGEYSVQQGFGWTNGVTQALLKWLQAP